MTAETLVDRLRDEADLCRAETADDVAVLLDQAADEIERLLKVEQNLRDSYKKLSGEHCRDCCCARAWVALGITEYTGKSIPEHIAELRRAIETT